jgi:hypothetical protein
MHFLFLATGGFTRRVQTLRSHDRICGSVLACATGIITLLALGTGQAPAAQILVSPFTFAQAEDSGSGYQLRSTLFTNGIWIGPTIYGMERAIVEYDLSGLPADIHSASLDVFWMASGYGSAGFPTIHVYGYAGDDAATAADATKTSNELFRTTLTAAAPVNIFALPVSFIEALISSEPASLGLVFTETSPNSSAFGAIGVSPPYPQLIINTIPEPSYAVALWICTLHLIRRREIRRHFSS